MERQNRLETSPRSDGESPVQQFYRIASWKPAVYLTVVVASNILPPGLKRRLLGLIGIEIGRGTAMAPTFGLDYVTPGNLKIGKNCIIGHGATVLGHEWTVDGFREGPTEIGDEATIGANSTVLPGVKIGEGATVAAHSLVNRDVEPGELVGGVPAETLEASKSETAESE